MLLISWGFRGFPLNKFTALPLRSKRGRCVYLLKITYPLILFYHIFENIKFSAFGFAAMRDVFQCIDSDLLCLTFIFIASMAQCLEGWGWWLVLESDESDWPLKSGSTDIGYRCHFFEWHF